MNFPTKKAAREAGYKTRAEWLRCDKKAQRCEMVPVWDAVPLIVKGEEFFAAEDCEVLLSISAAKRDGLVLNEEAEHVRTTSCRFGGRTVTYPLYRVSDFSPARRIRTIPATKIDLLLAIYTVNRSAKRRRDAARTMHAASAWGLATFHREEKERLYALKDRGISAGYLRGRLQFVRSHGSMAVYSGEGYSFHSTLVPRERTGELVDQSRVYIKASPRSASEARLKDAEHTLSRLPSIDSCFDRVVPVAPSGERWQSISSSPVVCAVGRPGSTKNHS